MTEAVDPRLNRISTIKPRKRLASVPSTTETAPASTEPTAAVEAAAPVAAAPATKVDPVGEKQVAATPKVEKKKPAAPKTTVTKAPASSTASKLERVPVRITEALHARLNAQAAATNKSQTAVMLESVERAHTANAFDFPKAGSSLFVGTAGRRRGPAAGKVTVDLRPRTEDLAVIVQLMEQHNAPDRTAFIVAALEYFLPE